MSISENQKTLVTNTFALIVDDADAFADQFYDRLFAIQPQYRALFRGDMKSQGTKLMQTVRLAVHSLDRLAEIVPAVKALGARHVMYGVRNEDYATVGQALLETLDQNLGDAFTDEVREAWTAVYVVLSQTAISGAEEFLATPA